MSQDDNSGGPSTEAPAGAEKPQEGMVQRFMHYLTGAAKPALPKALVYRTGGEQWDRYDAWPPKNANARSLYFLPGGKLGWQKPPANAGNRDGAPLLYTGARQRRTVRRTCQPLSEPRRSEVHTRSLEGVAHPRVNTLQRRHHLALSS